MATNIGDQLDAFGRVNQRATFVLLRQRMKAAGLGNGQLVADIARTAREQCPHLACIQLIAEVRRYVEGARGLLQLKT